jgi:integrase
MKSTQRSQKDSGGWNVYRRRDGTGFVLQYRIKPGEWKETRVPRDISSQSKAEQWGAAWYAEFTGAIQGAPEAITEPAGSTIRGLYDQWLALKRRDPDVEAGTIANYKSSFSRHILPLIGDVSIHQLGHGRLRGFLRDVHAGRTLVVKKPRASVQLVRNIAYSLTKFFDDALAEEWIDLPANPMRHPAVAGAIPSPQSVAERDGLLKRGEKVHITIAQAEKLVTCEGVPEWRRVLYLLAMTSGGFRPGELFGLVWSDIHFDEAIPRVSVRQAMKLTARVKGASKIGKTKTPDAVRDNPLHPLAVRALRAWKAEGWMKYVGRNAKLNDPVFPNPNGVHWRPRDARNLHDDLEAAGLPTKYRGTIAIDFKDATRHSFATWLAIAGVDDAIIGRLMGHAAKSVTRKHYIGDDLTPLLSAIKKIVLNLSTGKVVALPLALVVGGGAEPSGQTHVDTATLTAVCGKPAVSDTLKHLVSHDIHATHRSGGMSPVDTRSVDCNPTHRLVGLRKLYRCATANRFHYPRAAQRGPKHVVPVACDVVGIGLASGDE